MKLSKIFKDYRPQPLFLKDRYAVVLLLVQKGEEVYLLFEKRASNLRNQPGEISFPGGAIEKGESPQEAAIRETMEELQIQENHLEILGEMDYLIRRDGSTIRAFVGKLQNIDFEEIEHSPAEVESIFAVPLTYFLRQEPKVYKLAAKIQPEEGFPYEDVPGGRDYPWSKIQEAVYFYYWQDQIIWGLTAKLTYAFVQILKNQQGSL